MNTQRPDEYAVDIGGFLKQLWTVKWVWLVVFLLITGLGVAYAQTRPNRYVVTQTAMLQVPPVATEAEATQQSATLGSMTDALVKSATLPALTQKVLAAHPEVGGAAQLQDMVTVSSSGLMVEVRAVGTDAEQMRGLVKDLTDNLAAQWPTLAAEQPAHLRYQVNVVGDPIVRAASSGRTILWVGSLAAGALGATLVGAVLAQRRR